MLRKLEKYEILDEIGHGGMATVYRARDTRLDREVAVKIMHPHLRGAHEARVRFTREAQSVARLKHENILEIYDNSDPDSDEAYIVTELLTGPTLKDYAEKTRDMPAEVAASFGILVARALGCAHEAGIVHRDVKPENVLLHEDRTLKLTDFGIAQMVDNKSFTATGQILGSPGHMAPEQIESGDSDRRTDVFALGTVLYYLGTGRLPFEGKNPHQVLKRIVDGEFAHPLRVRPTLGGTFSKIIEKALAKDPNDRYQTVGELELALTEFVAETGIEDPAELVQRFLEDPAGTTTALRASTISALIELGRAATERGAIPVALDHYNRVLSLDDGNERVLRLIERIGSRDRQKTTLLVAAAIVAIGAVGAIAFAVVGGEGDGLRDLDASVIAAEPDGSVSDGATPDASVVAIADTGAAANDGGDGDAATGRPFPLAKVRPPVLRAPRLVRFRPTPENVEISVDGGAFSPFGPAFHEARLSPGVHRIRMRGACCQEQEFVFTVPVGPPDQPLTFDRRLPFKAARIYVVTNVPGEVRVNGRLVGRTHTPLEVPMESALAQARISVTAEGYREYTVTRRLEAGGSTSEIRGTLEEATGSAP